MRFRSRALAARRRPGAQAHERLERRLRPAEGAHPGSGERQVSRKRRVGATNVISSFSFFKKTSSYFLIGGNSGNKLYIRRH